MGCAVRPLLRWPGTGAQHLPARCPHPRQRLLDRGAKRLARFLPSHISLSPWLTPLDKHTARTHILFAARSFPLLTSPLLLLSRRLPPPAAVHQQRRPSCARRRRRARDLRGGNDNNSKCAGAHRADVPPRFRRVRRRPRRAAVAARVRLRHPEAPAAAPRGAAEGGGGGRKLYAALCVASALHEACSISMTSSQPPKK